MSNRELGDKITAMYAEVDREVADAGPVCFASGQCCRFTEYEHTLFLTDMEAEVLLADAPKYEKPVSADYCPFQDGKLCIARDPRPLGCRVYFCDPAYQEKCQEITEKYIRRLKTLAVEHGREWRYAPLHHFLNK